MTSQGSLVVNLTRERELLRTLNTALLSLDAQAEGKSSDLGFSPTTVAHNRRMLLQFFEGLRSELSNEFVSPTYQPIVTSIKAGSGGKPEDDWLEDITEVYRQLEQLEQLDSYSRGVLEAVVEMLDRNFSEDLKRYRFF